MPTFPLIDYVVVDVNPSFRLCLHDRDFVVGQQITENIIEKVAKSRKVNGDEIHFVSVEPF